MLSSRAASCVARIALLVVFSSSLLCAQTTAVDESFSDGNRSGQNPPSSLNWFVNTGSILTTTTTPGTLQLNNASSRLVVGYFAAAPLAVANGQTITFEITFHTDVSPTLVANGFNLALFNSGGVRLAGDFSGTSNPVFANYDGYGVKTSGLGSTAGANLVLRQRNAGTSAALMTTSSDWVSLSAGAGLTTPASPNVNYIATLAVTNNSTSVSLSYTLKTADGTVTLQSLSGTDTSSLLNAFDTVAFYAQTAEFPSGYLFVHRLKVSIAGTIIADPPTITVPPQNQTVNVGDSVTLSVSAAGTAPLLYQWFKDGVAIGGATLPSLALPGIQLDAAGNYTVTVTNAAGSITSSPAAVVVNVVALPPVITSLPVSQTVNVGDSVTFTVAAIGSAPVSYAWQKNGLPIDGATSSTLSLSNVQTADAGSYSVVVSNPAGSVSSDPATLTVNLIPPAITRQPVGQALSIGMSTTLTAAASGSLPLSYQWAKDGQPILGATASSLPLNQVQSTDGGSYTVTVTNAAGSTVSAPATLMVLTEPSGALSSYNLTGFATLGPGTTGGGIIPESDPAYVKVTTPFELAAAIAAATQTAGAVKVIEIMNDLNLGWNEIGTAAQNLSGSPFRAHSTPKLHPVLLVTGMSLLDIKPKSGLTIFSANGSTIRHCNFNIKSTSNIIVRNLKFDENWEWDEATKGDYDSNDWDFITLSNGGPTKNVWIDHCTFTKSYDGILDQKAGTQNVTLSWCSYIGDDGATNPNSWVRQQINALEANRPANKFYEFLRTNGFSVEDIVQIIQGHDKTHLMGSNELDPLNTTLSTTFHHLWLNNMWDRCVPRLRGGSVHDYNIYVDDSRVLAAKRLRELRAAALTPALRTTLNSTYSFNPPINGSISTEGGTILVERSVYKDCLWPLRNNQTNVNNPIYTGKIQALDTIYTFHNADGTVVDLRGNSTDAGNPMGPFQAPVIPFAWNFPGNQLPYSYVTDDPANLGPILAAGAGAGRLTWAKQNWLKTNYDGNDSAVVVTSSEANLSATVDDNVTLTVAASGLPPVSYQWSKDGIPVANTTSPALTLNHITTAAAGLYTVTVVDRGGSITTPVATLAVQKAVASVALASLDTTYDGTAKSASAVTVPAGLTVNFIYDGGVTAPTASGSYAVVATIDDADYTGSTTGTLTIAKGVASLTFASLNQTYDCTSKVAAVTTVPSGLPVALTYNGNPEPPVNAGSYTVTATIVDSNYTGSRSDTLVVAKAPVVVTLGGLTQTYDGTPKAATANTGADSLAINLLYNGSALPPINAGSYTVTATVSDPNYVGQTVGTLSIAKALATIALNPLKTAYTGSPITVGATTVPSGLAVNLSYDGLAAGAVYPGSHAVVATVNDANYIGVKTDTLVITTTALVRHAPIINGLVSGSVQVTLPEAFSLNGTAAISRDLLVSGTPQVQMGTPGATRTKEGTGSVAPSNYTVALGTGAVVPYVVRRIDPVDLPAVTAPPLPTGTRDVFLSGSNPSAGDFRTVRDLSLNLGAGNVAVPPGTYRGFVANNGTGFILGVAGASEPAVYNLQSLTMNGSSNLQVVGPVILTLPNGFTLNSSVGNAAHPEWLTLQIASGGATLNIGGILRATVVAPNGTVSLNGTASLVGKVSCDRLILGKDALIEEPAP